MVTNQHQVVKAEKIAATAAVSLSEGLVVPNMFQREGIDKFKGSKDDAVNVKVEGILPYRTYGWRNDRTTEIDFDEYREKTVQVRFGDDIYSGVKLTDEQNAMDLDGWAKLASKQTDALGRGLEDKAITHLRDAPYEVRLGLDSANLRKSIIRVRQVMNRLSIPNEQRWLVVGTDVEAALLDDDKLFGNANIVGDGEVVTALREASLGRRYGFNFVVAQELDPQEAVAMIGSAFIFQTGAPEVPASVPFGATASHDGTALRWIRDYDSTRFQDRSIFNCFQGFDKVEDTLIGRDYESGAAFVSDYEHFVRAIHLTLDGEDQLPDPDGDDDKATELGNITGLWATSDATPSADAGTSPTDGLTDDRNDVDGDPAT